MRRLPIYFLIDTSGSMRGAPIDAVNICVKAMIHDFRWDPYLLETAYVCVVTFNLDAVVVVPLTELKDVNVPHIAVPHSAPSHLGSALRFMRNLIGFDLCEYSLEQRRYLDPILVMMTDGSPSDMTVLLEEIPQIRSLRLQGVICCVVSKKEPTEALRTLYDDVYQIDINNNPPFSLSSYLRPLRVEEELDEYKGIHTGYDDLKK